ncbi:PQQ-dependent catabolism-associated CXXCW motif protein [Ancylobacter sp. Lp-2]|uniref:PQQ-dependent catabolism-associated CXXCW motif protein n=1 Tax=Ancylobacter sp. Lp-2 TaxID=2881339 RepID=UPI00351D4C07
MVRIAWLGMAGLAVALIAFTPAKAQNPAAGGATPAAGQSAAEPPVAELAVAEPEGYRMEAFRAPTPATLRGARVIDTGEAERLWRAKAALFVDVLPRDVKPANLAPGTIWRDKPRDHLPGSTWLPNVGYGTLSEPMDGYFRHSLEALTNGRRAAPVVFYCLTDCWMSWNAAKRAMAYGYTDVAWYPQGSDGWAKAGLPLEPATPRE